MPESSSGARSMTEEELPISLEAFRAEMREQDLEELVDELIGAFLNDAPGRLEALQTAVESGSATDVSAAAHAYKSAAATMRADALAELLYQAESAGREGDVARSAELLPEIHRMHEGVLAQLRNA